MSGIGGIIHWDERPVELFQIHHMMQMISHRGPDALWCEEKGRVGMGYALLATTKSERQQPQPIWLPDASCGIVADACIYNRDDVQRRLGEVSWWQDEPSDAALILAAYERWGEDLLDTLDGDFAFVIWDRKLELIFAARDPFGAKPLFYYQSANSFLFGSEPKQLLVMPDVPAEPDDVMIGEFLLWNFKHSERTFFKKIRRLKPAHYLVATSNDVVEKRWWNPDPQNEIFYKDPQEYFDQFRELLEAAVAKRLQTDYPVGAHLSGGFDSPSIVVLAAKIYRQSNGALPPLETISAVYGNLPCDESYYIEAVTKQVPFPGNIFNPLDEAVHLDNLPESIWQHDSPFSRSHPAFSIGCARIMSEIGARVQLNGTGGDQVAQFNYDMSDLARRGRFFTLIRESQAISKNSTNLFLRHIYSALVGAAPESIKRPYRRVRKQKKPIIPDWLSPEFAAYLRQLPSTPVQYAPRFRSRRQSVTFNLLNHPTLHWAIETLELEGCYNGYEPRFPYCDRPLVEFVLAIPLEQRLKGERWRYLHRRGLVAFLPPEIVERKDQTYFDSYFIRVLADIRPQLQNILFSSAIWHSAPYIRKEQAEKLFRDFSIQDAEYYARYSQALWSIASLEPWLRQLPRYSQYEITTACTPGTNA